MSYCSLAPAHYRVFLLRIKSYCIGHAKHGLVLAIILNFNFQIEFENYNFEIWYEYDIPKLWQVYVEFAVKNPLLSLQDSIDSELFKSKIETFINTRIREM